MVVCDLSHHHTLLSIGHSGGLLGYSVENDIVNILKLSPLFVDVDAVVLKEIVTKYYPALNRSIPEKAFHYQSS